ncbi:MAG: 5'-3' exonuclease, partial [Zetaproteobacteria bacterium]
MPKLLLIDVPNAVYRAFFAQRRPLHAPDGTPTQAVFGFAQMLHKAL